MEWTEEELKALEEFEKEIEDIAPGEWYIPGISHAVDFSLYRQWSNARGGKKEAPE